MAATAPVGAMFLVVHVFVVFLCVLTTLHTVHSYWATSIVFRAHSCVPLGIVCFLFQRRGQVQLLGDFGGVGPRSRGFSSSPLLSSPCQLLHARLTSGMEQKKN